MTRICLFAQYAATRELPAHTRHFLHEIGRCGYEIHVAVAGRPSLDDADRAVLGSGLEDTPVFFYPHTNEGLDFGAWQYLMQMGLIGDADEILLANDSVFGPFAPLSPIMDSMRARRPDVWGMVLSRTTVEHLQSWFLVFSGKALRSPAIQRIFAQPFREMTKAEIILHGELGLGLAIHAAGFQMASRWENSNKLSLLISPNPMHMDWRTVLKDGTVPFIKAELLRDNPVDIPDVNQWRSAIRDPAFFDPAWIEDYLAANPRRPTPKLPSWRGKLIFALAARKPISAVARLLSGCVGCGNKATRN